MKELTNKDIEQLDKIERMHLINSCSGIKSANLIGTVNSNGTTNLAIFNSVSHLGSNPPMLTFLLRPKNVDRHTYENIMDNKSFTINHVPQEMIKQAHQTSAKYAEGISEFDACGFSECFSTGVIAPFVKEAPIQIACEYVNEYHIKEQDCYLIVGKVVMMRWDEEIQHTDGWLDLAKAKVAGCIGLDGYVSTQLLERYEYARPEKICETLPLIYKD